MPPHFQPSAAEINQLEGLYKTGHHAEAESEARSLLARYPDAGAIWELLGLSLHAQGRNPLQAFLHCATLMPDDAGAQYNLGNIQKRLGQFNEAAASFRRAIAIKPDFFEAHASLGNALNDMKLPKEAADMYRRALDIRQNSPEVLCNLGATLSDIGLAEEGMACFRSALQIAPDFAHAYSSLGNLLAERRQFEEAAECYRHLIELAPLNARAHFNFGIMLRELDRRDAAAESFRRALEADPENIDALVRLGLLSMETGDMQKAVALFRKVLQIRPGDLDARYLITQVCKAQEGDENFTALLAAEEAVKRGELTLPEKTMIELQFALGKCWEDIGESDRAFPCFIEGNRLKRTTLSYDAAETSAMFDNIMRTFSRDTIERLRRGGNPTTLPIFVIGMPRSGTTLVEQIISSHSDVHGAGELPDLLTIAHRKVAGTSTSYPGNILSATPNELADWGRDYIAKLERLAPDAKHVTDKMPANYLALGLIHVMFPNAKVIHVNRNPADTCVSNFMQLFSGDRMYHTFHLEELGKYYADYARLMAYWRSSLPASAFFEVQYEDVVADLETEARRIASYCGLAWDDACIDFHKSGGIVTTASIAQVRQPIYGSSVERWRRYERFLAPLLQALGDLSPTSRPERLHLS